MSDPLNEDDIIKILKLLLSDTTRHERMIGGLGVLLEAVMDATKPLMVPCDDEECSSFAQHSCGGKHKRFLCDRHLAIELMKWKTKEAFEAARELWTDLPQARAYTKIEEYLLSVRNVASFPVLH